MNYIVWQKTEFGEDWHRYDAAGDQELTEVILERTRHEGDIEVTVPISYWVKVGVGKVPEGLLPTVPAKPSKEKTGKVKEAVSGEKEVSGADTEKTEG